MTVVTKFSGCCFKVDTRIEDGDFTHRSNQLRKLKSIEIENEQLERGVSALSLLTVEGKDVLSVDDFGSALGNIVYESGDLTEPCAKLAYATGTDIFGNHWTILFSPLGEAYDDVEEINVTYESRQVPSALEDCFARANFSVI